MRSLTCSAGLCADRALLLPPLVWLLFSCLAVLWRPGFHSSFLEKPCSL